MLNYYVLDNTISDAQYNQEYKKIKQFELENPLLVTLSHQHSGLAINLIHLNRFLIVNH